MERKNKKKIVKKRQTEQQAIVCKVALGHQLDVLQNVDVTEFRYLFAKTVHNKPKTKLLPLPDCKNRT